MIIQDKVKKLVNGSLRLQQIGENLGNGIVRLNLSLDQITAMWISRDILILRFCWGETYREVWDVILNRSLFTKGDDRDFIRLVTKNIRGEELTYDINELELYPGEVRLANKSTNLSWPFTQRRVKIYHNFWGPFKKREQNKNLIDKSRQG